MDLKCTHARSLNDLPPRRPSYRFLIQESFSTPSTALQNKLPNNQLCTAFFSYLVLYYQGTNRLPSPPGLRDSKFALHNRSRYCDRKSNDDGQWWRPSTSGFWARYRQTGQMPGPRAAQNLRIPRSSRGRAGCSWNWLKCIKMKARIKAAREKVAV